MALVCIMCTLGLRKVSSDHVVVLAQLAHPSVSVYHTKKQK